MGCAGYSLQQPETPGGGRECRYRPDAHKTDVADIDLGGHWRGHGRADDVGSVIGELSSYF